MDQNWVWSSGASSVRLRYGYDRVGNALYREDLVNAALSELYRYDQLDRLTSVKRGVLSATNDAVPSPTFQQSWTLDARGNQATATTNGSTVSRAFNNANETTTISGATAPTYDAAGNTTAKDGRSFVYDAWGRLKRVAQGKSGVSSFFRLTPGLEYMVLGTVVERTQPWAGTKLTFIRQPGDAAAGSDAGDTYSGLDRFGRVVDQNWVWTGGAAIGTPTVRLQYGRDRVGNATFKKDLVNAALSELYRYDQLDRLTSTKRGVLSATNDAIPSPTFQQSWTLDARGNQATATTDGSTVARTFNEANETTSVSGATAPIYDAVNNRF